MPDIHSSALHPLRYEPAYEVAPADEEETARELREVLMKVARTVLDDESHAYRAVHAKSHGLLLAELQVAADLPPVLAQGVFAKPARYPVAMRFSTVPGDLLPDSVSTPRGLAIKIVGVGGERVAGSEGQVTQDFVMVNGPAFNAPSAKKFLSSLKLLAGTTDKAPGLKQAFSGALRGLEALIEKAGGESPTLKALGGQAATHILGDTFYTQAPFLYGPYMAKLSVAPVSPELVALKDAAIELDGHPDALRELVIAHFRQHGGEWEVRVQLCADIEQMPIEDASVQWPEDVSPYLTVARIVASPQPAWSRDRSIAVDDGMAFSPWHALAAHRPIGSIMRVRKAAYEMAAQFRSEHNATHVTEPKTLDSLPD